LVSPRKRECLMKITSNPHKPVIKEGAWSLWLSGVNNRPFLYHRCHAHHSTPNEDFGYTIQGVVETKSIVPGEVRDARPFRLIYYAKDKPLRNLAITQMRNSNAVHC
jgi:hypothetical protein